MENVQMLLPIEPAKFWSQLKAVVEEEMELEEITDRWAIFNQKTNGNMVDMKWT